MVDKAAFISGRRHESGEQRNSVKYCGKRDLWAAAQTQTAAAPLFAKAAETRQVCAPHTARGGLLAHLLSLFNLLR